MGKRRIPGMLGDLRGLRVERQHQPAGGREFADPVQRRRRDVRHGRQDQRAKPLAAELQRFTGNGRLRQIVAVQNVVLPAVARKVQLQRGVVILRFVHRVAPTRNRALAFLEQPGGIGEGTLQRVVDGNTGVVGTLCVEVQGAVESGSVVVEVPECRLREEGAGWVLQARRVVLEIVRDEPMRLPTGQPCWKRGGISPARSTSRAPATRASPPSTAAVQNAPRTWLPGSRSACGHARSAHR